MTPCQIWPGSPKANGYGQKRLSNPRRTELAHRWVYEQENGPIPEGLEIDHTCNNRICVNLEHLEAVTHEENMRRARERNVTCKAGHVWAEGNEYIRPSGARQCRACSREVDHRRRAA